MDEISRNLFILFLLVIGLMIYQRCKSFNRQHFIKGGDDNSF